jgi:hypothetical protein
MPPMPVKPRLRTLADFCEVALSHHWVAIPEAMPRILYRPSGPVLVLSPSPRISTQMPLSGRPRESVTRPEAPGAWSQEQA